LEKIDHIFFWISDVKTVVSAIHFYRLIMRNARAELEEEISKISESESDGWSNVRAELEGEISDSESESDGWSDVREELKEEISDPGSESDGWSNVRCGWVLFRGGPPNYKIHFDRTICLREGHTPQDREDFLVEMDRDYEDGFGQQNLFGVIWLVNGQWIKRSEYDGSECWTRIIPPQIPLSLQDREGTT
jgi:hypothetical protein